MPPIPVNWHRLRPEGARAGLPDVRVKVLHSFYRSAQPSGENEAVVQQVYLLAQGGLDVELISLSADDLEANYSAKLLTAAGLATGTPTTKPPAEWLAGADVLHIHNTFPAMSHDWLAKVDIPKVITAHNYRAFCANGLFLRDGGRCLDCTTQGSSRAVIHGCYRGSRIRTIPIAMQQRSSRSLMHLMDRCYRVLLPGAPMQETFQGLGITNTHVLPHPVNPTTDPSEASSQIDTWLFVGRISPEKGLIDLLRLWPSNQPLVVVGDGPDRQLAEKLTLERNLAVKFLGSQGSPKVRSLMASSRALIFPSKAMEGAPLVYGEAMQAGLPIVAANGSTLATQTLVDHTGAVFTWDDPSSLTTALGFVAERRAELANRAQAIYESRYTPEAWINDVTEIYRAAISAHQSN